MRNEYIYKAIGITNEPEIWPYDNLLREILSISESLLIMF